MNDSTKEKVINAIALLDAASEEDEEAADRLAPFKHLLELAAHPERLRDEMAKREAEPKEIGKRYFLYQRDDGEQRVYRFREWSDGRLEENTAYFVSDKPPKNAEDRWDEETDADWPATEAITTTGREVSKNEVRQLTGYDLPGGRAIEEACLALERVPEGDELYLAAQAGAAMLCGLSPVYAPYNLSNIFAVAAGEGDVIEDSFF